MARIARKHQKIFALGATNNGQFGSAQIATFVQSADLDVLQALPAFNNGWVDAIVSGEKLPTLEEMQALDYINTSQIAYLFQEGIPEYLAATTYYTNSVVKKAGTYELYGSITNNNTGNALSDPTKWQKLSNLADTRQVFNGGTSTGTANAQVVVTTNGNFEKTYGYIVTFTAGIANTSAATLNVDATGVTAIKKDGVSGLVDVAIGDIIATESYQVFYNGTYYVLVDPTYPTFGTMASQNANAVAITGGSITLLDTLFTLQDNSDPTKQLQFQISGITAGQTRTLTAPDANTTIAGLSVGQTFSAIQTVAVNGTPLVVNSLNSTATKITFQDANVTTGFIGSSATNPIGIHLAAGTLVGGWDTSGHLRGATASTYDLGTTSLQWRNIIGDRITVLGTTIPTEGIYRPASNTLGLGARSLLALSITNPVSAVNYYTLIGAATGVNPTTGVDGSDTNIGQGFTTKGTGSYVFYTNTTVAQVAINHTASAVNYLVLTGSTTGNAVSLAAQGSDTNIGITLTLKGTGIFSVANINITGTTIPANGLYLPSPNLIAIAANSLPVLQLNTSASSVNLMRITASATSNAPVLSFVGTDTNVSGIYTTQGTGVHNFYTAASTLLQFQIAHVASAVNYIIAQGGVTGNGAAISATGSDANVTFQFVSKGQGPFSFYGNTGSTLCFIINPAASQVNYFALNNTAAGTSPNFTVLGSDTNLNFVTVSKGTGVLVNLGTFTNGSATTANVACDAAGRIFKNTSQAKYKYDIENLDPEVAFNIINEIQPIFYRSALPYDQEHHPDWSYYGLVAEQVAKIDPRLAHWDRQFLDKFDEFGQPIMSKNIVPVGVNYDKIALFAIVAFRAKFESFATLYEDHEIRIQKLESEIEQLKKTIH